MRVRVRQWDDMAKEYGTSQSGEIKNDNSYFRAEEKYMCGKRGVITHMDGGIAYVTFDSNVVILGSPFKQRWLFVWKLEPDQPLAHVEYNGSSTNVTDSPVSHPSHYTQGSKAPMPPIGVTPKWLMDEKRIAELSRAIKEYADGFFEIRTEWVEEYNKLISESLKKKVEGNHDNQT
jgi:hypothetical protein